MGREDKSKFENVVDNAAEAFWAEVAKQYPEIKTGDDTGFGSVLRKAMGEAVGQWLLANMASAPTTAACEMVVEMRPPMKGERGWSVEALTADGALAEILRECDSADGSLGWIAQRDHDHFVDENGMHDVTIVFRRALKATTQADLLMAQGFDPSKEVK